MSELYNVKAVCHVCGKAFMARYNLKGRAKVCTPPSHECRRKVEKRSGMKDRVTACVEGCCRSKYRLGAAASSMDDAIDPRKVLSDQEFKKVWASTKHLQDPEGITLRFIASTGCRLGESLLVRKEGVVWGNELSIVKVPTLKRNGRPVRSVHVKPGEFLTELKAWVKGADQDLPLFPVAKRTLQRALEKVLLKIKPDRASLVHIFRHTRASQLIKAGADWNYVRQQLGWSSLAMAKIYGHTDLDTISSVLGRIP